MKLHVKDVGEIEVTSPFGSPIAVKTREWTIVLSDQEVTNLIVVMIRPMSDKTGIPISLFLVSMLQRGLDDMENIKETLPILAAVISEKRRLDGVGVLE